MRTALLATMVFAIASRSSSFLPAFASNPSRSPSHASTTTHNFGKTTVQTAALYSSTLDSPSTGFNTRLDNAFKASKEKEEAAFIGFITAGYPSKVRREDLVNERRRKCGGRSEREATAAATAATNPAKLMFSQADTVELMLAMEAGGTSVIELGVPYTDPQADGATIQLTNQVAIKGGTDSIKDVLGLVKVRFGFC